MEPPGRQEPAEACSPTPFQARRQVGMFESCCAKALNGHSLLRKPRSVFFVACRENCAWVRHLVLRASPVSLSAYWPHAPC
jgi:hypothetical protein